MIVKAEFSFVRIGPRKVEGIASLVRGRRVEDAMALLQLSARSGARHFLKLIRSAVANADHRGGVDVDKLYVKRIYVNGGPRMKRWRPRSRGMAQAILKRMSHLCVELAEK